MKRKTLLTLAAIASVVASVQADTTVNHEISLGFSDLNGTNQNFIGIGYRHYLDEVVINDSQAWSISPYLQKINTIQFDYIGISDVSRYQLSGRYFVNDEWVVSGRLGYLRDTDFFNSKQSRVGVDVGKFVSNNWELGAGIDHFRLEETLRFFNSDALKIDDSDTRLNIYARYTNLNKDLNSTQATFQPGWDITTTAFVLGDQNSLNIDASYFFKQHWSVYAALTAAEDADDDVNSILELGTEYWFSPHASVAFGLGTDLDEATLASATLLGTWRF
jgi:hypothetical protein